MSCSQNHSQEFLLRRSWNCILPIFKVLPSKIGYLIISSLLFRYSIFKDLSIPLRLKLRNDVWWRLRESNPWPPACKAGALPAELNPRLVGTNGLEPSTSRLSGVRSNHLSYAPVIKAPSKLNNTELFLRTIVTGPCSSLERRWSSRTFRYGYLVTT